MAELVLDSGVAIKWFVPEPYTAKADQIFADYQSNTISLLAPDLIYAEFGNIVWKKRMFQGLNPTLAEDTIKKFHVIRFTIIPASSLLDEAYLLAIAHRRTVYDMLYLALSLRAGCQFVTADEKLVNAIGSAFTNVIWLANWP
jgi:predicted nucleic acid-binding protein